MNKILGTYRRILRGKIIRRVYMTSRLHDGQCPCVICDRVRMIAMRELDEEKPPTYIRMQFWLNYE